MGSSTQRAAASQQRSQKATAHRGIERFFLALEVESVIRQRAADRDAVRTALAALPDDCREILALRESAGLSYDEIAAALSLEVGTVKSRLNRARKKLCIALLKSGNFSDRFPSKQGKGCEA